MLSGGRWERSAGLQTEDEEETIAWIVVAKRLDLIFLVTYLMGAMITTLYLFASTRIIGSAPPVDPALSPTAVH